MRKIYLFPILLLAVLMILPDNAEAQRRRKGNSRKIGSFAGSKRLFNPAISFYGIGGGINALNYFGDIAPTSGALSTDISFTRPGINLFLKQKFGDRYHWRANFMWGRLQSSDAEVIGTDNFTTENANRYLRNLSFRNDVYELSATAQIDLFKHNGRFTARAPMNLYVFGGLGILYHNPKAQVPEFYYGGEHMDAPGERVALENAGEWVSLRELGTEGQNFDKALYKEEYGKDLPDPYSRIQIVIPVGIGARYKLSNHFDIGLEISYRHTFTDYLDDVGSQYVDLGGFIDAEGNADYTAMAMSDMSNQFTQEEFNRIQEFTYTDRITNNTSNLNPDLTWRRAAGYGNAAGFGNDDIRSNIRGNNSDNDIFIVTNIQLTYILGGSFVRGAKFR